MTDEKSNSLMADLNTDLNEPASPGDVNEGNPLKAGCTEPEDKPEPSPALTRFYKNRSRNSDLMRRCKHMLIAGMPPGKVALLLRLPIERVQALYENSYNPICRRFAKTNAYTNARLALTSFNEGADLVDIAAALGLSLYWVITSLRQNGITDAAMAPRMPPYDDPLYVEYRRVCERKAANKFRPIQISPVRRPSKQAGQTATA
ncbi:hypothetical protein [Citrobacter freundii]|uniref:hypothetical protein n=1 Tax=Citrobacter freundii TaxID=546 RepID=UPI000B67C8E7|nr:hypothetical protein [Citrobacter freundii]OUE69893.1 hypothetical protein AZ007_002980 [Citrobacter freundii]